MTKKPVELDEREKGLLAHLLKFDCEVELVYQLSQGFVEMVRERQAGKLENWLIQIEQSGIDELKTLGKGIKQDKAAVLAGLSLEWSQGQTEGQVNRIKMIKRTMFGRAGFDCAIRSL
jgi:transposase